MFSQLKKTHTFKNIHTWSTDFMNYGSVMLERRFGKGMAFFFLNYYMHTIRLAAPRAVFFQMVGLYV